MGQPPKAASTSADDAVWGGAGNGQAPIAVDGPVGSGATTAGSMRSTAYPATAPAPKPGVNTRVGVESTPSRTASWIARGMLAAEVLPTRAMLKYIRSWPMPACSARSGRRRGAAP